MTGETCSNIRPVSEASEIGKVVDLARVIWTEHYSPIIGIDQVRYMLASYHSRAAIETDIAKSGARYFLIDNHGRDVGYLSFRTEGDSLFLSKLYVLSSDRGQGLGRRALDFVRDQAERGALRSVRLTVNRNNSGSIAAYERFGFVKTGEVIADIGEGYVMDDYSMEWNV